MKKKKLIIIGCVTLAIIGFGVLAFGPKKKVITYDTAPTERGTLVRTVEATGTVVSSQDVESRFEVSGRISAIPAKVGATVKAGEVLARLDDRDAASNAQRAQAAVLAAQATLDKLSRGATGQDIQVSLAAVASAQSDIDASQQALIDLKASDATTLAKSQTDLSGSLETLFLKSSSTIQVLKNDVYDASGNMRTDFTSTDSKSALQASASFKTAQAALIKMGNDIIQARGAQDRATLDAVAQALIVSGNAVRDAAQLSNQVLQAAVTAGSTSQVSLDTRKSEVKLAWTDIVAADNAAASSRGQLASSAAANLSAENAAQARVNASEANLGSAEAALNFKKAPASAEDIENARAVVAEARASASSAQAALDKTRIVAPFNGTISQINGKVGLAVSPADAIVRVHGMEAYEVEADVPETDVGKLAVGMDASITLDAYGSDKLFSAKLTSIDTAETVIQDIVYYKTRFALVSPDVPVRLGMSANVTVVAEKKDGILIIPLRAVHGDPDKKTVSVLKNGTPADEAVTIGMRGDENRVEILSGLSEGDAVVMAVRLNGKIQ